MSVARAYFAEHPEKLDDVRKATFAYHLPHVRSHPGAHNFGSVLADSECRWCGRTRTQVRWDDLPAECGSRPPLPEIEGTIETEERKAWALLARAEKEVPALWARGKSLTDLHQTYGYDPETVASIVPVSQEVLEGYAENRRKKTP